MALQMDKHSTLCWECTKNAGKCSWSRNFTPVKGWKAIPTKIKVEKRKKWGELIDSFDVYECPEFELIERLRKKK